ncbi:hypothetical protein [Mucilaginibacter pedocola]|uniref:Uncharacterized protein n=1 Tax=Mucilaginibacter pedocola TaxID=1792845 RepID=A0A1S9P888_9SPHI|nr:hypothetical protein [Mucilaginibacter pedocola]OOQ57149.1 hypothetical protein BC343_16650 [Mucilaginibacter pedocola]
MKTEIFLENEQLDISVDLSALLTISIDDVRDFSSRQTSFSKTIVLPGTAKNNRIFGHIYDIGQANVYDETKPNFGYNFNASKSAACIIFQDNIQTFRGVLRILQINIVNGRIEYEVSVFGDLFLLNAQLSSKLLQDLDLSEYDHTLSLAGIINSWDNTSGSGYFYPLIDHGNYSADKHSWDYRTFRPAIYVKEYLDKMFGNAGFRYRSVFFNSTRFAKLVIPYNRKTLTRTAAGSTELSNISTPSRLSSSPNDISWATITGSGFTFNTNRNIFTFAGSATTNVDIIVGVNGTWSSGGTHSGQLRLYKNGSLVASQSGTSTSFFSVGSSVSTSVNPGDTLNYQFYADTSFTFSSGQVAVATSVGSTAQIPILIGDPVPMNEMIPKNIRQIDFLVSIVKLFNLYVYEDKFDSRLICITPYVDFFGTDNSESVDWTYKLNRDANIQLKPMSELNAKLYKFQYKSDSDYYNDLYNKRYGQSYGSYIFNSQYEFADQTKSFELIFAPTPLVGYNGEDKVYSTILKQTGTKQAEASSIEEEQIDSVVRILQAKKITDVASWAIKDGATTLTSPTDYGYAGHLDDPDAPTNDLNFGALEELFFVLASGTLSNTQFNLYWSSYMAEITDKDGKLLTASFYLTPADIYNLDLSKYINIDGVLFRLNKISDYNLSTPGECQVELLKVNYTLY